jgi:hypothetical protein
MSAHSKVSSKNPLQVSGSGKASGAGAWRYPVAGILFAAGAAGNRWHRPATGPVVAFLSPTHAENRKPILGRGNEFRSIPEILLQLWQCVARYPAPPECCLVNLYRAGAKMGLHQDRDEVELEAPVVSLSLGDGAVFRFGGVTRKAQTSTVKLSSGDVISFGGPARLMFHGIDRVIAASSQLIAGGGRINLTLRRVTKA